MTDGQRNKLLENLKKSIKKQIKENEEKLNNSNINLNLLNSDNKNENINFTTKISNDKSNLIINMIKLILEIIY